VLRLATRPIIVLSSVYCSGIEEIWDLGWAECRSTPDDDFGVCLSRADVLAGRSLRDVAGLALADAPAGRSLRDDAGLSLVDEVCGRCPLRVEDVVGRSAVPPEAGGRWEARGWSGAVREGSTWESLTDPDGASVSLGLPPKHIVDFDSGFAIEIIYRDLFLQLRIFPANQKKLISAIPEKSPRKKYYAS
jgi:hypothetical protein